MDKVIIDGVDVSGCEFCMYKGFKAFPQCKLNKDSFATACVQHKNCYYKQLKRLQAENEELKKVGKEKAIITKAYNDLVTEIVSNIPYFGEIRPDNLTPLDVLKNIKKECKDLQAENERLKEENYQLQKDCQICENFIDFIPCKPIRDMDYDLQKVISQRDNYYQALQEIREIFLLHLDEHNWFHTGKHIYMDDKCINEIKTRIIDKINSVIGAEE